MELVSDFVIVLSLEFVNIIFAAEATDPEFTTGDFSTILQRTKNSWLVAKLDIIS